jgi:hypothetical protein
MTGLISITAAVAAALALAAPAVADVTASRPGDVGRPADAFARDSFRSHPGAAGWTSLRPLGSTWSGSSWS